MGINQAAIAAAAIPVTTVGFSANAYITAAGVLIGTILGTGGLYGILKGLALLSEQRNARLKVDNDAAALVRKEMMEFNAALQDRVAQLEQAGREERRRWDDEMAGLRKTHAQEVINVRQGYETEIRALRDEISGLRRQMVAWQRTSGAAVNLSAAAPTAAKRSAEVGVVGDMLREAFGSNDADNG